MLVLDNDGRLELITKDIGGSGSPKNVALSKAAWLRNTDGLKASEWLTNKGYEKLENNGRSLDILRLQLLSKGWLQNRSNYLLMRAMRCWSWMTMVGWNSLRAKHLVVTTSKLIKNKVLVRQLFCETMSEMVKDMWYVIGNQLIWPPQRIW